MARWKFSTREVWCGQKFSAGDNLVRVKVYAAWQFSPIEAYVNVDETASQLQNTTSEFQPLDTSRIFQCTAVNFMNTPALGNLHFSPGRILHLE